MNIDAKLLRELEGLSAKEAAEIIANEFGDGETVFYFALTGRASCANMIAKNKDAHRILAEEISPIRFLGGPPNNRTWHRGTLMTWVCDLVLYAWVTNGAYAEMVV
jgi:hypothetical protein